MIGDRPGRRLLAAAVALAGIGGLMAWWALAIDRGEVGNLRATERPDGTPVVLSLLEIHTIEGPSRYVIGRGNLRIPIDGPTAGLREGAELTVGGVVRDHVIVETWREPAPDRPAKKRLGLLGLALGAALAAGSLRPVRAGVALRG